MYQLVEKSPGGPLQILKLPSDEQFSHDYLVRTAIIYVVWRGLRPGTDLRVVHEMKLRRFFFPPPSNNNSSSSLGCFYYVGGKLVALQAIIFLSIDQPPLIVVFAVMVLAGY